MFDLTCDAVNFLRQDRGVDFDRHLARLQHPRNAAFDGRFEFEDIDGLRNYLLTRRRDAFLKQFCRKLLGYSLGRAVQLSDRPLLTGMQTKLEANQHRITTAIETIVQSRQFREIRGREFAAED